MIKKFKIKTRLLRIFQLIFIVIGIICISTGIIFIFATLESNRIFEDTIQLDSSDPFLIVDVNYRFTTENIEFEEGYPVNVNITMTPHSPHDDWEYCYVRLHVKSKNGFSSDMIPYSYDNIIVEKQWLYPTPPSLSFEIEFPMDGKYWSYVELYNQGNLTGEGKLVDNRYGEEFKVYSTEEVHMKKSERSNVATLSTALFVGGATFVSVVIGLEALIFRDKSREETKKEKLQLKREKLKRKL